MPEPSPYIREAIVTLVPGLTDEQLGRIGHELEGLDNPSLLVSRLNDHSALIQGIPVRVGSPRDADAATWETLYAMVRTALRGPFDRSTMITAIDVLEPVGVLAS